MRLESNSRLFDHIIVKSCLLDIKTPSDKSLKSVTPSSPRTALHHAGPFLEGSSFANSDIVLTVKILGRSIATPTQRVLSITSVLFFPQYDTFRCRPYTDSSPFVKHPALTLSRGHRHWTSSHYHANALLTLTKYIPVSLYYACPSILLSPASGSFPYRFCQHKFYLG